MPQSHHPRERLRELGLVLPAPPTPIASYLPFTTVGDLICTSGVLAMRDGQVITGRLGSELTTAQGAAAARVAALSLLALLEQAQGDLARVSLVQLTGYVRSALDFTEQAQVVDGASQLFLEVLGESGRHARVSVGVAELARGACVHLQLLARR